MTQSQDADRYFTLAELVEYSRLSLSLLYKHMKSRTDPIPFYKVGTRILIRKSEFDDWLRRVGTPETIARAKGYAESLEQAVKETLR